jgi:RHS repeat-associated protein
MATGSGGQVNNTYDESGRMTVANPGKEKERSFTYDANGNLTSIQARNNPHYNQEFTYDALNRLISATGRYGTISYTYDNVGNRLTRTIDDQTETYSYIAGTNRLQGIAGPNPITFTYDANGNTTGMGDKTLAYNQNNRLINAEENSTVLGEYTYNGRGQRVKKSFNGETILFIYDQAGQLISEADDKGDILREYVYLGLNRLCQFVYKIPKHIEVRVTTSKGRNLGGINVYAFTESGSYTGLHAVTDDQGVASFETEQFSEGNYKFRADYVSYQFWSSVITVPGTYSAEVVIEEETAEITVTVAGEAKEGVKVYVFNEDGTYLGIYGETDSQGKVSFDLPVGYSFKFRADHMASQYWSDTTVIGSGGSTYVPVDTGGGVLTVTVQKDPENPIAGINVYLFSASGTYLAHFDTTDGNGQVSFTVSEGNYKVRADYQQNQYWATEPIDAHQVNVVNINTGGGEFILTVEKQAGSPLVDVPVYVFTSGGTYLGITAQTDDQGEVAFDLSDGDYKFRADYLSGQFWTDVVTVPTTLSDTLVIPHQDVTITVNGVYGAESDPLEGVSVYLFTASGSYMGQNQVTNSLGQVTFNLPQEYYKVRLDYLSGQFWSDVFVWQDADVDIDHGIVDVHVTFNGEDVADAPVYLFTTSGSYLGRYEYTDAYGHAAFLIPAQSYKFRVDYDCTQYWSDVVNVIAHEETDVEMPLEQLAFNKTNDPNPSRYDGKPPVFEPERIKVASIGSLAGILSQSIIANTTPPKVYYYLNDHLGTPQLMTDENNVVVWEAKYRPFGEAVVHPYSTVENNIRFPGQYFDQETGLHYNYHRYYDPRTGRYLRADPSHFVQPRGNNIPYLISFILNSPQEQNYYTFVKNDPINNIDMYGLISIPDYRCIEKCQVICGLQAADCFRRAIYYPDIFIGAACLVLTRGNVYICASVVGGYSVISFYICAKQEQKCLDDCISNCEDICFQ